MRDNIYLQLIAVFAPLSLLSLGGGQSIVADINQQAVAIHGWVRKPNSSTCSRSRARRLGRVHC
ncbi:hypothetical protein [Paraburkholderia sediminicola]|uniref:hypothetical protein n=1 Tax=Paraburkholderia sediminicola TaxID=458836 RepID=UPI0038BDEBE6